MAPGRQSELRFEIEVDRRPASTDVPNDIVGNGSFIFGPSVLPAIGYRRAYEIDDPGERRRRGLPERAARPPRAPELATWDVVVTAPADQTVVAPGIVRGAGESDGRRWTRFAMDRPAQPILTFASARYAIAHARVREIDVEVLYHPAHAANVPRVLEAATRSLEYCIREYGPYPYPALRIAETPAYDDRFGGYAVPGVVYLTEDRAFLTDLRDPDRIDIVTKRTAHEVAHQWWGHQVTPPSGPGASAVVETIARYTELMVLKERYGPAVLRPVLEVERGRYLAGRRGEVEPPLARVEDQAYVYYAKGGIVLTALQGLIGEERVNGALCEMVTRARTGGAPVTARDLGDALARATPPEHRAQLDEWWNRIVLDDVRVVSAHATPMTDGRFRVEARIDGTRSELVEGRETPLAMEGTVEVAIYAEHPDRSAAAPLAVTTHSLHGTPAGLAIAVDGKPAYVVVDPHVRRIDRNPEDNVRAVEARALR
jgi:aminopeptidase N